MHDAKNCLVERYVPHGMDIFEMFADLSYAGVLAVLVAVNTAPILMPPTWIILSSFYARPAQKPTYSPTLRARINPYATKSILLGSGVAAKRNEASAYPNFFFPR